MNHKNEEDLIYSTLCWEVRLNPNQKYLGRCVVALKRPCPSLSDVTPKEMLDFLQVIKGLETLLKKTFNATMFNWACSMNHAYQVNPPDPLVHWHMIPRYIHPIVFRGKTFSDERFGYRSVSEEDVVPDDIFSVIADTLRKNIKTTNKIGDY
jgi:diadenosine tetraphosphate (Ap4A) HIT family hydrolase